MVTKLSREQSSEALPQWRHLLQRMHLTVRAPDFATALHFVARVGQLAQEHEHHPDVDLRFDVVHLVLSSHDVDGITDRDVRLGLAIDEVVSQLGLRPEVAALTMVEIAVDALDIGAVRPFWRAVLDYDELGAQDLRDPLSIAPALWLQQMEEERPQRNRMHVDVTVAHDEAAGRIERALAAGGHLVSDAFAPSWWVLSDVEGNEACICTWQARDPAAEGG